MHSNSLVTAVETITIAQEDPSHEATAASHNLHLIKKDDNIRYKLLGSDEWISATVLGRAGKATGGNKTWYNVKDHEVEDGGHKTISTRWVITNKNGDTRARLVARGCRQSKLDPALFILTVKGSVQGIFCCHVDDFLHAGNEEFEKLMEKLRKRFIARKIEEEDFLYIGFMIKQNNEGIQLYHSMYMEKLDHQHIEPQCAFQKLKQLTQEEQKDYRRMVGELNWAVQGSRPDLAFELVDLSTKLKSALVCDLLRAIKNIGKLKDIRPIHDAAFGNINDGKGSTGAHIVWIKDRIGIFCPISWQANKIKRVVRSTIAAEALSLQDGLEMALYFRKIIEDICGVRQQTIPITAFIDNKSVTEALKSTKLIEDKRLRIDIEAICEMIQNNYVEVKWCPGKVQLANSMTKRGASGTFLNVLQKGQMLEELVIGTTKKGIGPTYSCKATRNGLRMCDLLGDFTLFSDKYQKLIDYYTSHHPDIRVNVEEDLKKLKVTYRP
ncbi:purA [Mytilus coruscus]|uniref:PurA n=1 Tax=Mytilus coruscus TaxID=42192 RepID=A0A6J8AAK7_MYTCO|nr:purA [Mytilus coruscus]